ncbi:Protein of unknown function [Micromonospora coriariae]|uniref:DUF3068 domain-containing protein n=1 Tax=Micromonospora coriariae TaxID=285665 RepID=A0A1C4VWQ9_9ACTN|nr:Protein of unknown function [Micromonospora coriariae]
MKRIVGAMLFGLGVLLVVAAVGLPLYVAPAVSQLPYDLERSESVAESANAEFLQIKAGAANIERGGLRSTVEVVPQPKITDEKMTGDLEGKAVVWDVFQSVRRIDNNEMINEYSTQLAVDRVSGAAAKWDAAWLEDGTDQPANYAGQVYKFPFGTEKKDYPVFDREIRKTVPAQFKEVTEVRGVQAYRFEQTVPEAELVLAESSLKLLLARFAPEAKTARLMYTNTRSFWVEPVTGSYVDVRDQPRKVLVPDVGQPTVLLSADFRYNEATVIASAERAADNAASIQMVRLWGPITLGVLGLLAIVGGGWLALRGAGRRAAAESVEEKRAGSHRADKDGKDAEPEAPTAETPTAETPTAETPTAETPTAETPTAETPTAETPTAETPTAEAPTADAPTADAPTVVAPSADSTERTVPDQRSSAERPAAR